MKKMMKSFLVILLGLLMSVNVMADVQQEKQSPDYTTDYYMMVESPAGGIDMYALPDLNSTKLNDSQISNGTALHIEGETEDPANNRTWGYTEYHGMHGYVPLDDCTPVQSRTEAIASELSSAGSDNVNYDADYDVKAYSEDGSQKLYQGPGSKYGEVPGVREIQNGETLHITEDAALPDGSHWGKTSVDGEEGWMDLEKTEEWVKEHGTVTPSVTVTPEPTATPQPTVTPEPTATPKATATPEPTATPQPTATPEPTDTPAPTDTPEPTETQEPTVTEGSKDADNANVQASGQTVAASKSSASQNPLIWIAGIAVLAAIGIVIYHYKKR